jgi:hypothetical protein
MQGADMIRVLFLLLLACAVVFSKEIPLIAYGLAAAFALWVNVKDMS